MAFSGSFQVTPNPTDPTSFQLLDNSSGSDNTITDRQVTLTLVSGGTLVPAGTSTTYIDWSPYPIPNVLTLTGILVQDYSLRVSVVWVTPTPTAGNTYTATQLYTFTGNTQAFIYYLIQQIAGNQTLLNDQDYVSNLSKIQTYLDSAIQAQTYGDQGNSQIFLNLALNMIQNKTLFWA